jgi:DNA-binding response OmpR family regulator
MISQRMEQFPSISPQTESERAKILVVDDQPAKLLSYEVVLKDIGATLIKASSACEAFECLLKGDVALILIDVCMPEIDGFELASLIREHPRFQRIAIIFVSALMHTDLQRLRGYELGALDYITVPIEPELLRAKVRVFIELQQKTRQLESLNAELERRVAKRTAELRRRNEDLEKKIEERTREREALLAQRYEAQQADAVGHVGGVVHDFNNLLMAVLGSLSLLERKVPEDRQALALLRNASQAASRGASLTRDLLAFSRRREINPTSLDIGEALRGMRNLLEHALGFDINLNCQLTETIGSAFVDANQLQLAVLNMAIVAREAVRTGGRVLLSAAQATQERADARSPPAPGNYVRIRLDAAPLSADAAPEAFSAGTSLGFSIAQAMALRFGGLLTLNRAPNCVVRVELWLPRTLPRPPARKPVDHRARPGLC